MVLRVWQDEVRKVGSTRFARITANEFFKGNETNLGYSERTRHVDLVRHGSPCYLVMCVASDIHAIPRVTARFNEREVFVGGRLEETEGEWWIELASRESVQSVRI